MAAELQADGRRTRHAHRHQELLDAATDYVFEHGLRELSLRPLGAAIGVSHRTLLYHFGSKEQLFSEILREARTRERLLIAAQLRDGGEDVTFGELLRRVWARTLQHLPFFRAYYEVHGLALQDPERYRTFLEGVVADWVSLTADVLRGEGLDDHRAEQLATLVWAAARGLQLDVLTTGDVDRVNRGVEELVAAVEAALATAAAPPRK